MAGTDTQVAVVVEVNRNRRMGAVEVGLVPVGQRGSRLIHTLVEGIAPGALAGNSSLSLSLSLTTVLRTGPSQFHYFPLSLPAEFSL